MFVLIGNLVMEIRGLLFSYWLILFSTACFANMLGLLISDGLKSVVAIYVIVPFLLVPQILLAGVIVKFDKLHYKFASDIVVPLSGDMMPSRWAYEALAVNQFVNNAYQRPMYETERIESNITYDLHFLIPAIDQEIEEATALYQNKASKQELSASLGTIENALSSVRLTNPYPKTDQLNVEDFTEETGEELLNWLEKYQSALRHHRDRLVRQKDLLIDSLKIDAGGLEEYIQFKRNYFNEQLAQLVLNRNDLYKLTKKNGRFLRKMDPVYTYPTLRNGRAHFFASVKLLGNTYIPTLYFNLLAIWTMTIIMFVLVRYSMLKMLIDLFVGLKARKAVRN